MKGSNEKVSSAILRNISDIIRNEVKDPKIGFITVTDCEVTNDLSYAKVYVTFLGKEERKKAGMKALERSKGFIRRELSRKIKTRKCPELIFVLDDSLERSDRIENILNNINSSN